LRPGPFVARIHLRPSDLSRTMHQEEPVRQMPTIRESLNLANRMTA